MAMTIKIVNARVCTCVHEVNTNVNDEVVIDSIPYLFCSIIY